MRFWAFVSLVFLSGPLFAKNFYVVVRGSSGYYNYRHEADAYHFVKMLTEASVARSQIVMMTYDDIAFNINNPKPGFIENHVDGPNVYLPNFKPDYTGDDVNPTNFLRALENLPSTSNDNIWIYFTDHGATDLIAFPNDYLYADTLMNTLNKMFQNKKYAKMFFYLEACESGSMFSGFLSNNMNIYAVTAATPFESSYACCMDPTVGTYTGDEWSVNFLNDLNKGLLNGWSFNDQFDWTHRFTQQSTPCQYGNLSMGDLPIGTFWASNTSVKEAAYEEPFRKASTLKSSWEIGTTQEFRDSIDALFGLIIRKYELAQTLQAMKNDDDACDNSALAKINMARYKRLMAYYPTRSYLKHTRVLALLSTPQFAHISEDGIIRLLKIHNSNLRNKRFVH